MAQDDIQGQVVDGSGNPVSGAIVELTKSYQSSPTEREKVFRTTTDSNGNYIFTGHPDGDGTTQEWHVSSYSHDGTAYVNSFNNPGVTAELPSNAIPDSVVLQYYATQLSQGDSTWLDDTGTADMSITGDPQDGTLSDGSESAVFDGVDDYGSVALPSSLDGESLNSFSIEVSIEYTSTSDDIEIMGVQNSADEQIIQFEFNGNEQFDTEEGNFYFLLDDSNSNQLLFSIDGSPNLNDGSRQDISIIIHDASQNDVEIIVNGSSQPVAFGAQNGPSSFSPWDRDIAIAARNRGSVDRYFAGEVGAIRFHDEAISSQTISDYP